MTCKLCSAPDPVQTLYQNLEASGHSTREIAANLSSTFPISHMAISRHRSLCGDKVDILAGLPPLLSQTRSGENSVHSPTLGYALAHNVERLNRLLSKHIALLEVKNHPPVVATELAKAVVTLNDDKSKAMADQLTTATKERLLEKLGVVSPHDLLQIERVVKIQLGLKV